MRNIQCGGCGSFWSVSGSTHTLICSCGYSIWLSPPKPNGGLRWEWEPKDVGGEICWYCEKSYPASSSAAAIYGYSACSSCESTVRNNVEYYSTLGPEKLANQLRGMKMEKFDGAVRMFRFWHLVGTDLVAMTRDHKWLPGANLATGFSEGLHSQAGFYGFASLKEAPMQEESRWESFNNGTPITTGVDSVVGTFLAYGRVKVGTRGARAEYAVPEYILEPTDFNYATRLLTVADKYRMRMITREQADSLKTGVVPWVRPSDG